MWGHLQGERDRGMGAGTGVGEGEFLSRVLLPSIRTPVIHTAREERSQKVGLQTLKGGGLELWFVGEGGPSLWVESDLGLSLVVVGVGSWLGLLLLR